MQIQSAVVANAVLALFPDAVDPEPPRGGVEVLEVYERFGELVRNFQFREGTGRHVPFPVLGNCLEPLVSNGQQVHIDPGLRAKDGDVVLVAYNPDAYADLLRHPEALDFQREHGIVLPPTMIKALVECGADYVLIDKSTGVWLDPAKHTILGVMVCGD